MLQFGTELVAGADGSMGPCWAPPGASTAVPIMLTCSPAASGQAVQSGSPDGADSRLRRQAQRQPAAG
ncbi:malate:quinone oxidoreductase [Kocuria rhizophila]|nr:malate:quinone oxidoreductase [Kocuria rhizophila]